MSRQVADSSDQPLPPSFSPQRHSQLQPLPAHVLQAITPSHPQPHHEHAAVFEGQPEQHETISHHERAQEQRRDEEQSNEKEVQLSAFKRQISLTSNTSPSVHRVSMLAASLRTMLHIAALLLDLMLIDDYHAHSQDNSAAALIIVRILHGIIELHYDFLNHGWTLHRLWRLPFIFLNLSLVLDWIEYVKNYSKRVQNKHYYPPFRANVCFQTFLSSLPSLIIQTYVIIDDPRPMTSLWSAAIIVCSLLASFDLLSHLQFLSVSHDVFVVQWLKAVLTTGVRTLMVAYLLARIGIYFWLWIAFSYVIGVFIYVYSYYHSLHNKRDDPFFYSKLLHVFYGGTVGVLLLFVSVPFAVTHAVFDWWLGYLLCELKMAIENFIMAAIIIWQVNTKYRSDLFYSVTSFSILLYIANLVALWFLHLHIKRQLLKRNLYSDHAIVYLFANMFAHFRHKWHADSFHSSLSRVSSIHPRHFLVADAQGQVAPTP